MAELVLRFRMRAVLAAMLLALPTLSARAAEDEPQFDENAPLVIIKAGKIITVSGDEITNGLIVLQGDKIRNVGKGLEYPRAARVIDATDRVVMPGMINPKVRYGLPNYGRRGVHSNLTVAQEYVAAAVDYEELLKAGYTLLAQIPDGRDIPGWATLVRPGVKGEGQIVEQQAYLLVRSDKPGLRQALKQAQAEIDKIEEARKKFEEKKKKWEEAQKKKKEAEKQEKPKPEDKPKPDEQPGERSRADEPPKPEDQPKPENGDGKKKEGAEEGPPEFKPPPIKPPLRGLVALLRKEAGRFAVLDVPNAADYLHLAELLESDDEPWDIAYRVALANRVMAFGANIRDFSNFVEVADELAEQQEHVLLYPYVNRLPNTAERFNLAAQITDEDTHVAFMPPAYNRAQHASMRMRLAELVRAGLPRAEALRSVTLSAAEFLGVEDRFGSVAEGKQADLIFLDADPLTPGARVREVMVAGEFAYRFEE